MHLKSLEDAAQAHLKTIVSELIKKETIDGQWTDIIVDLAMKTVNAVKPDPKRGDKMDIRHYVKVYFPLKFSNYQN